jgi:hypothetical protein
MIPVGFWGYLNYLITCNANCWIAKLYIRTVENSLLKYSNSMSSPHHLPLANVELFLLDKTVKNNNSAVCQTPYPQWWKLYHLRTLVLYLILIIPNILEKVVIPYLYWILNLIYNIQFGFQLNYCPKQAIIYLHMKIYRNKIRNKHTTVTFLDVEKYLTTWTRKDFSLFLNKKEFYHILQYESYLSYPITHYNCYLMERHQLLTIITLEYHRSHHYHYSYLLLI